MHETKTICLKRKICQLRQLINQGDEHKSFKLHLPTRFILDCPKLADFRCNEINSLATTGFEEARHVVRLGTPA